MIFTPPPRHQFVFDEVARQKYVVTANLNVPFTLQPVTLTTISATGLPWTKFFIKIFFRLFKRISKNNKPIFVRTNEYCRGKRWGVLVHEFCSTFFHQSTEFICTVLLLFFIPTYTHLSKYLFAHYRLGGFDAFDFTAFLSTSVCKQTFSLLKML